MIAGARIGSRRVVGGCGAVPKLVAIVVILALTFLAVSKILFGGSDPQIGACVDAGGALVGCGEDAALYKLVREVDDARECPSESQKLYQFRSRLYCGVALKGAPPPSGEVASCLLLAGAELARNAQDLAFAAGDDAASGNLAPGVVKVRGDGWRIFYVLFEGQLDPGLRAILANPAKVLFVAYITEARARRKEVAAATGCATGRTT
jgi:hypothetical protein